MTRLAAAAASLALTATLTAPAAPAHAQVLYHDRDCARFQLSHPERGDRVVRICQRITWRPTRTGASIRKVVLVARDNYDSCQDSLAWEHPVQAWMRYWSIRAYTREGRYVRDVYLEWWFRLDGCRNVHRFRGLHVGAATFRSHMTGKARIDEHFDQWFRLKAGN